MGQYTNQDCLTELEKVALVKADIRNAIRAKGVEVPADTVFADYSVKIADISGGKPETTFTQEYTSNGEYTITAPSSQTYSGGTVSVNVSPVTGGLDITANGSYSAKDHGWDGFSSVNVNVSGGGGESPDPSLIYSMGYNEAYNGNADIFPYAVSGLGTLTLGLTLYQVFDQNVHTAIANCPNLTDLNVDIYNNTGSPITGLIDVASPRNISLTLWSQSMPLTNSQYSGIFKDNASGCNCESVNIYIYEDLTTLIDTTTGIDLPTFKSNSTIKSLGVPLRWTKSWTPRCSSIEGIYVNDNHINGSVNVGNCPNLTRDGAHNLLMAAANSPETSEFGWTRTLTFNHTFSDSDGQLANYKARAEAKGFTITGLTLTA